MRSRPPPLWALVARLLIRGEHASEIRRDLSESFERDLEKGIPPARARRRYALNVVGSAWSVMRGRVGSVFARGAVLDARLGIRMLGKEPLLTGVAMLALGLGIPASLTFHHLLDVLNSPLPVPEGERVMGIRHWDPRARDPVPATALDLETWRESLTSFERIAAARSQLVNLHDGDDFRAPPVRAAEVTASAFDVLRVAPLLGRPLGAADEVPGARDVVVLGEDLWASRFARDPDIVGSTVVIGRTPHTVVGVMPSSFRFPVNDELWLPLRLESTGGPPGRGRLQMLVFGRLADGIEAEAAHLEVGLVSRRMVDERADLEERVVGQVVAMPVLLLREDTFRDDPEVLLIQSINLVLLLIVCGNVGVLILARTVTRTGEISIRTALGASRGRIVVQLFVEALVLALVAAGLGLGAAEVTMRWLMRALGSQDLLPYWVDLTPSPRIVSIALGLAVVSAVVAGVIPAFKATSRRVRGNLQRAATGVSVKFGLGSSLLIVSEVVLSVGFLAMGATVVRTVFQDRESTLGFEPEQYLVADVWLPARPPGREAEAGDPMEADAAVRDRQTRLEVLDRVSAEPAVRGAALAVEVPGRSTSVWPFVLEAADGETDGTARGALGARVSVDYFRNLDRTILAGRDFAATDLVEGPEDTEAGVIVNTSFVERILEGRNPLGVRFRRWDPREAEPDDPLWYEVVGVVGPFGTNVHNPSRDATVYYPVAAAEMGEARYLLELTGDPVAFVPRLREIVAAVDPEAIVEEATSVAHVMEAEGRVNRWAAIMLLLLAAVAFVLSVTGLYALMSFTVSQRTREIGIRTALGARPWSIVSAIARRTALQLGIGLALGAAWAWMVLDNLVSSPEILEIDRPLTVAATVAVAALVGILGCAAPTLRGLRIQPTEALREL